MCSITTAGSNCDVMFVVAQALWEEEASKRNQDGSSSFCGGHWQARSEGEVKVEEAECVKFTQFLFFFK